MQRRTFIFTSAGAAVTDRLARGEESPKHWHALTTIWACQSGKHVSVEKPGSHNLFEGRKMIEAAAKYNRIVQHGVQLRSSAALQEAVQKLSQGVIGRVYMSRALIYRWRPSIGSLPDAPVETAHYASGLAHLGNIAYRLGRRLESDPATEKSVNDPEADRLLTRPYRPPLRGPEPGLSRYIQDLCALGVPFASFARNQSGRISSRTGSKASRRFWT